MSLETLIEAARYLEYKSEAKARGEEPQDYHTFARLSRDNESVFLPKPNSRQHPVNKTERTEAFSPNHLDESKNKRRPAGTGTREIHNTLEKNRRAHLKECFETLKRQLPNMDERKTSNLTILRGALRYIQTLKRKEREYEHEMEQLARDKIAAQQRLAALKKELSSQMDYLDINSLLPDHDNETTTTASECEQYSDLDDEYSRDPPYTRSSSPSTSPKSSSVNTSQSPTFVTTPTAASSVPVKTMSTIPTNKPNPVSIIATTTTPIIPPSSMVASKSGLLSSSPSKTRSSVTISAPSGATVKTERISPASATVSTIQSLTTQGQVNSGPFGMTGVLGAPHAVQVIANPGGVKVIATPSLTTSTANSNTVSLQNGSVSLVTTTSAPLVALAHNVPTTSAAGSSSPTSTISTTQISKAAPVTQSLVRMTPITSVTNSKPTLISPVTLVTPQAMVNATQVATAAKSIIINQASGLANVGTSSSVSSPVLAVTQVAVKSSASVTQSTESASSSNALRAAGINHTGVLTTLQAGKGIPQIITSGLTPRAITAPTVLSTGATLKPVTHNSQVRASTLSQISGVAHVTHVISQASAVSQMGPLVAPLSVVNHPQMLAQTQQLGKVLAAGPPILKSMNHIPILGQQFLQPAMSSLTAHPQPVVKPVVVVSVPSVVSQANIVAASSGNTLGVPVTQ